RSIVVSSCEGRVKNARRGLQFADTLNGRHTELFWHTSPTLQVHSQVIFRVKHCKNRAFTARILFTIC
ncbi:hypothetical protein ACGLFO_10725, partial [Corynebacterium hesseae]|uniref:hypothetical protein n=1 Tax=Corynebacterium hesseae TaxID=2913502 RepID=UPI00373F2F16